MKKLLLPAFLVATIFSACSKSDSSSSTPAQTMTATINGTAFTATQVNAGTSTSGGITELYIIGQDASNKEINIGLTDYSSTTGAGTYNIGSSGNGIAVYTDGGGTTNAASGQVVISSISGKTIKGTFNFITYDSTNVANGSFSAQLP